MKFMLGEKIDMTQTFNTDGDVLPITLIRVGKNQILQVKTKEKEGYSSVQIGFGDRRAKNIKKPQRGAFKDFGNFRYVKEFRARAKDTEGAKQGDMLDASQFAPGEKVNVSGISKAKGFQGGVKRYGFGGASATHGTKHAHRQPGSIGATGPQKVLKGTRMAGRMGGARVTVRNLEIAGVDAERGVIALLGAVPGKRGTLLEIRCLSDSK